jgi:hypothetical protein
MSSAIKVKLGPGSRRVMEALADTIIPSDGPERPGAIEINLVDRLLEFLGRFPFGARGFVLLCWAWEFCPLLYLRFARFSRLLPEERIAVLEKFEHGGFTRRWGFILFKSVIMASYYRGPDIWPLIGYEEGCLSQPGPDRG